MAHTRGTLLGNDIAYFDAYMTSGDKCGKQVPITGWQGGQDRYTLRTKNPNVNSVAFSLAAGTYTVPIAGAYHCCMSARCKQGGVCDFTIRLGGR